MAAVGALPRLLALALAVASVAKASEEDVMKEDVTMERNLQLDDPDELLRWYKAYSQRGSSRIVYNRMPKTGSGSMRYFLGADIIQYEDPDETPSGLHFEHTPIEANVPTPAGTQVLLDWYRSRLDTGQGVTGEGHFSFIDLPLWGLPKAVWFTVMREPANRIVSHFYYMTQREKPRNATREECGAPLQGDLFLRDCAKRWPCFHCTMGMSDIVRRYFISTNLEDRDVTEHSRSSIAVASAILHEEYLTVLPLEDIQHGWQLLECLMPGTLFDGLAEKWAAAMVDKNVNRAKPPPDAGDVAVAARIARLTGEQELYHESLRKFCGLWRMAARHLHCPSMEGWEPPERSCGVYEMRGV